MTKQAERCGHRSGRKCCIAAFDACLVILALAAAEWFGLNMTGQGLSALRGAISLSRLGFVAAAAVVFFWFGFSAQLWCYASIPQYAGMAAGAAVAAGLLPLFDRLADHLMPPAFYILFWMVLVLLLTIFRLLCRLLATKLKSNRDRQSSCPSVLTPAPSDPHDRETRIMIIGAGYAASQLIREMAETGSRCRPVVLIDDDPDIRSHHLRQVAIVGDRRQIRWAVTRFRVDEMILTIPDAPCPLIRELIEISRQTGCRLQILPRLNDLISGRISVRATRQVTVEDLLGRPVQIPPEPVCPAGLADAVVLVTGGGGSVGAELCRQIAAVSPKRLIVFDFYENNVYELQQELLSRFGGNLDLVVRIGNVCDSERLDELMCQYRPDIVFHAAACKQVPLMQTNPGEAVKTNLFGTYQTALAAARNRVRRFVLLSTVGAGNPTGVMDATMRLAEMTLQSLADRCPATLYTAVRFSNVLGSNGSVVPLFQRQIRQTRCITVTHPEMRRCFITLKEAAQLVIQAGTIAPAGTICVQNWQETIRIADLATDLIRLSGLEPENDVSIDFTGLRSGEKLTDASFPGHEQRVASEREGLFTCLPESDCRVSVAEIDRFAQQIGWSSHALRRHLAWLKASVKPAAGLPKETVQTSDCTSMRDDQLSNSTDQQLPNNTGECPAQDCAYLGHSAVYTLETTQRLPVQLTKTEVL